MKFDCTPPKGAQISPPFDLTCRFHFDQIHRLVWDTNSSIPTTLSKSPGYTTPITPRLTDPRWNCWFRDKSV